MSRDDAGNEIKSKRDMPFIDMSLFIKNLPLYAALFAVYFYSGALRGILEMRERRLLRRGGTQLTA